MRHDETIDDQQPALARERGADLAAFYDRRAAAALAYCARLCPPEAIADAVEASFARVFDAAAAGEAADDEALDRSLRAAVRTQAASRTSSATTGVPARRLLERLADPNRGGACELMPALLVARAGDTLSEGDGERMQAHLRRCADCRAVEQRFDDAERSYDALIGSHAPALGRSLLAEMLSDAPLGERRRFARDEPLPRVVKVPEDALEPATAAPRDAPAAPPRDPGVTSADTADFPALGRARLRLASLRPELSARARRRVAVVLLVVGLLLSGETAATLLWKEPFTAYLAAQAQDDLSGQLHKLESAQAGIAGADAQRLAASPDDKARMALLAGRERRAVPAGDALGLMRIGKLDAEYVVVQSTRADALRKGPGHYGNTPLPGEGGTVGIAGHRTTYEAPFRHIDELKPGDTITLKMPYGLFTYAVDRQRIVPSGYRDAFAGGAEGTERLVLSACHPLYSASERILVYAHLVGAQPLGAAAADGAQPGAGRPSRDAARQRTAARLEALGTRTLVAGMTGPDVKELQRLLGVPATGTFGPQTSAAVLDFQRGHGLPAVGRVGSQTKAALARRPHAPSRPPTPPSVPPQRAQPGGQPATPQQGQQPGAGYKPPGSTQPGYAPQGQQPTGGSAGRQSAP